jgi:hypothetical protein
MAPTDPSWTPDATAVLRRACDRYGGTGTWRTLRTIRLVPERLTGLLPWIKGVGKTFPLPKAIEISPHERRTVFVGYPDDDQTGTFDNGAVRIERRDGREIVEASDDHRKTFRGLAKHRRWGPLDALYFFGYALWHYHAVPFTLGDARLVRCSTTGRPSDPRDVLDVELPADVPTHSRRQSYHFDATGLITRHDYHAEIVGGWARGAHLWKRQTMVGFPIALERHVVARLGSTPLPVTALHAIFSSAEVSFG